MRACVCVCVNVCVRFIRHVADVNRKMGLKKDMRRFYIQRAVELNYTKAIGDFCMHRRRLAICAA